MENIYKKKFERVESLELAEYESCEFVAVDFTNQNLNEFVFINCTFTDCNLGMVEVQHTSFKQVKFKDSKLLGVRFDTCNPFLFEVHFESCYLNLASFYKMKIRKAIFKNCSLSETDFVEAQLVEADFSESILSGAVFENTNLKKANFLTAKEYVINPETNRIKKAKFSVPGVLGLLEKYDIIIK